MEIYPEHYNDEDKAIYDDLISRGQALIGKKIKKCDEFLLDLSAKITINKMKGYSNNFSDEEVETLKNKHKETAKLGIIETPPDIFYEQLQNKTHPLSKTSEEYYEEYNKNIEEGKEIIENV